ncbi:hypothetical protein CMV_001270 [Castanea mollissima]|uniref:Uncharacterized protein n=1 Tax=Castanea mollissima TaxID=60419 RepID=A0A8J4W4I3_9ROSI|nr:hypothetical protein CMV_001270 [Castanea mollissima]
MSTTQVSHVAHLCHLQLVNPSRHYWSTEEKFVSLVWGAGFKQCQRRGAETTPIVIAKFTRLEAEAAIAKNNETEARAMLTELLQRERAAKLIAEKARVAQLMANDQAHKYKTALVISWLTFVILFVFLRMSSEFGLRQMFLP